MTPRDFDEILGLIQDDVTKTNTNMLLQYNFWLRVIINCSAKNSAFRFFVEVFIN